MNQKGKVFGKSIRKIIDNFIRFDIIIKKVFLRIDLNKTNTFIYMYEYNISQIRKLIYYVTMVTRVFFERKHET